MKYLYNFGIEHRDKTNDIEGSGTDGRGCAMNVFEAEHDAVPEMEEGPPKSACRRRLQTAVSCFRRKCCGGERYG
jgi:hypothetical protein